MTSHIGYKEMPIPRFSSWVIQDYTTCSAGASSVVDVDLEDTFAPQICIKATWGTTASTTGYSLKIYRGYLIDGVLTYTTNYDTVTITSAPTPSASNQTTINDFAVDPTAYPRYLRLVLQNLDASNPMTFKIVGDN